MQRLYHGELGCNTSLHATMKQKTQKNVNTEYIYYSLFLLFNPSRVGTFVLTSHHGRNHGYWN
jgi:hypothetical protein